MKNEIIKKLRGIKGYALNTSWRYEGYDIPSYLINFNDSLDNVVQAVIEACNLAGGEIHLQGLGSPYYGVVFYRL